MLAGFADHENLEEVSGTSLIQCEFRGGASIDTNVRKLDPGKILKMAVCACSDKADRDGHRLLVSFALVIPATVAAS
jgi:hypothetical protein